MRSRIRFVLGSTVVFLAAVVCMLWLLPVSEVHAEEIMRNRKALQKETRTEEKDDTKVDNGIPVIYITIDESQGTIEAMNSDRDHKTACVGTMDIVVPEGFRYSDMPDIAPESFTGLSMTIRGRGNSTWKYDKKPYKIKLDKKKDLFGLGANKHWVLLANAVDETLMKDRLTAWLGTKMGFAFTPQCVPVDVVMNGKYLGSYDLAEQVRVGENRLELDELTEEDTAADAITGGYLIQYGQQVDTDSPSSFKTSRGEILANHTPNFDPSDGGYENSEQMNYIRNYVQKMEDAMFGEDHKGPDGISYREYMDIKSAADYWLIQQVSSNGDAYCTGSTYFYKEADRDGVAGKIIWGPLWDFDIAWGTVNADKEAEPSQEGFTVEDKWELTLLSDPVFREELAGEWPKLKELLISITKDGGLLDQYYAETKDSWTANSTVWISDDERTYTEIISGLKQWIDLRTEWIDQHLSETKDVPIQIIWRNEGEPDQYDYYNQFATLQYPQPKKEGYVFLGWEGPDGTISRGDEEDDGENYATKDCVYTARFIEKSKATKVTEILFPEKDMWGVLSNAYYGIRYTLLPVDAQDRTVVWTSSDPSIARVSEKGQVEMLRAGTVDITAALPNGEKRKVKFTVVEETETDPASVTVVPRELQMKVGERAGLSMTILPRLSGIGSIVWEAMDPEIVNVNESGFVEAKKPGITTVEVRVVASSGEGEIVGSCTVRVILGWRKNRTGWWYGLGGGEYYRNTWKKIDGKWYYFNAEGYMAANEFVQGWWIEKNGEQKDPIRYSWHKTKNGWWYGVKGGWYAKGKSYVIDGVKYTFTRNGYLSR